MSDFHNRSSARRSHFWQYKYDDEEPVSFEGLKAHRYSIVIGFWVGLAVFVIFMFFVLTLLTKIGAPHQENPDPAERHHQPAESCQMDEMEEDVEEGGGHQPLNTPMKESELDKEGALFSHVNIPNFVECSSTLGEDDLLQGPSVILESRSQDAHDIR